jgi:signal peptidase I
MHRAMSSTIFSFYGNFMAAGRYYFHMKLMAKNKIWKEILTTSVMIVGLLAFRSSFAEPYTVPTGSMEPTIVPGDRLLVNKAAYDIKLPFSSITLMHLKEPTRGDIVFLYPKDTSINFVKRLIGLPGDELVIRDGLIEVNGAPLPITPSFSASDQREGVRRLLDETLGGRHHLIQRLPHEAEGEALRIHVPEDSYFFMGDNRDNSNDSRFWGFVPKSYLKGKAMFVWLSLDSLRGVLPTVRWARFGQTL